MANVGNHLKKYNGSGTGVIVTKIGRKYFTVENIEDQHSSTEQFLISDLTQKRGPFGITQKLYASKQEWEDDLERHRLHTDIAKYFHAHYRPFCTLAQYQGIAEILGL